MRVFLFVALASTLLFTGCQSGTDTSTTEPAGTLTVYAGRSQSLVDALVERFEAESGIDVDVRYGRDAELIATLEEEGAESPADVFWANTPGALGAVSNANLLTALPDSLTGRPDAFVPSSGLWVPVTIRFRTMAYNTNALSSDDLPGSVLELPGATNLTGRMGWTPTYSSFQDFVTAMTITEGEDATNAWIDGIQALEPIAYSSNTPMLQALAAGEIDVALTNHYYILRITEGEGDPAPVATHFFEPGDVGNLALVTGAGLLQTSDQDAAALSFLRFLLSEEAENYSAERVYEYPVIQLEDVPDYLLPFEQARALSPTFDFEQLRELEGTLALLRDQEML
ncbi:MAG: iron ABC transporter substrate-binding protein [Bacteroidota bacterium]